MINEFKLTLSPDNPNIRAHSEEAFVKGGSWERKRSLSNSIDNHIDKIIQTYKTIITKQ
jgi:hypothetical protein